MRILAVLAVLLGSYAVGCMVAAYYVVRLRSGTDVRAAGSGTAGARNVLRTRGRLEAALTLALDVAKAAIAVLVAARIGGEPWAGGLAFVGVVTGHVWPAQLGFHGGKGAAPALGAMLAVSPAATAIAAAVLACTYAITRRTSRAGLLAIAVAPVAYALVGGPAANVALTATACGIVLLAHHPRMARPASPKGNGSRR